MGKRLNDVPSIKNRAAPRVDIQTREEMARGGAQYLFATSGASSAS